MEFEECAKMASFCSAGHKCQNFAHQNSQLSIFSSSIILCPTVIYKETTCLFSDLT